MGKTKKDKKKIEDFSDFMMEMREYARRDHVEITLLRKRIDDLEADRNALGPDEIIIKAKSIEKEKLIKKKEKEGDINVNVKPKRKVGKAQARRYNNLAGV